MNMESREVIHHAMPYIDYHQNINSTNKSNTQQYSSTKIQDRTCGRYPDINTLHDHMETCSLGVT